VLYVPVNLEAGKPAPLVLDLPAYSPAELEEAFSEYTRPREDGTVKADEVGAVVVTPEPMGGAGALRTWNFTGDAPGFPDDQLFFADLLADVGARTCIDRNRVLATGFAVGGVMAALVACNPDFGIAALATISGPYDPPSCARDAPLPVVAFHGTADPLLPFDGGPGPNVPLLGLSPETVSGLVGIVPDLVGAPSSARAWAEHDRCASEPETSSPAPTVTRASWGGCAPGGAVDLYVIEGAGHTWPGSHGMDGLVSLLGPTTAAIEASDVLWDFFLAHVGASTRSASAPQD
jgi:polyhydroxybutyrate depolymerase